MLAALIMVVLAADPGPKVGSVAPALKVRAVATDAVVDLMADRKGSPTVVVLVRSEKFNRPLARGLKELDRESFRKNPDARVLMVFLAKDTGMWRDRLVLVNKSLQLDNTTLGVTDEDKLMSDWAASSEDALTVVVVHEGKVVRGFGYRDSASEQEARDVVAVIPKAK